MDSVGVGMAVLGFSAPVTAAVLKLVPRRENGNGLSSKYVTIREFDAHRASIESSLKEMREEIRDLDSYIRSKV